MIGHWELVDGRHEFVLDSPVDVQEIIAEMLRQGMTSLPLRDTSADEERGYNSLSGVPVETVLQAMLDVSRPGDTLYVPDTPLEHS